MDVLPPKVTIYWTVLMGNRCGSQLINLTAKEGHISLLSLSQLILD